jgi:hypothetical protein
MTICAVIAACGVIASQRVRPLAGPMTGFAKQSRPLALNQRLSWSGLFYSPPGQKCANRFGSDCALTYAELRYDALSRSRREYSCVVHKRA